MKLRTAIILLLVLCGVVLFLFDPMQHAFLPRCPFKLLTGLNCPGCGLQRAAHAALHGRLLEAAGYNLFLLLALPYLAAIITVEFMPKGQLRSRFYPKVTNPLWAYIYVALFFVWWIVRNLFNI